MEKKIGWVVLEIDCHSFSALLNISDGQLISFSIDYNSHEDNFTINGADVGIAIDRYYYMDENDKEQTVEKIDFDIPEDKDLLEKFNETIMKQYKEKIAKREISESEAKQLLLDLLDYIDKVTKEGAISLTEKVRNSIKNIKVEFRRPEEVLEIIKKET